MQTYAYQVSDVLAVLLPVSVRRCMFAVQWPDDQGEGNLQRVTFRPAVCVNIQAPKFADA